MLGFLGIPTWSPYIVGVAIGLLVCLSLVISDRPLGCSTGFVKTCGLIERIARGKNVENTEYYREIPPRVDWQFTILPGIVIGAFISSFTSGVFSPEWIPPLWDATFGDSITLRVGVALLGGILLGIGARWAGGCTSGHGISGNLQLSVGSMVSSACFFIGGILTAMGLMSLGG